MIVACTIVFLLLTLSLDLTEAVDIYSEWIDAADAAQKEEEENLPRRPAASSSRPAPAAADSDDDDD